MLLELATKQELWVVLPDSTNLRIDCRGPGPAVMEHCHRGRLKQAMTLQGNAKKSRT